MFSRKAVKVVAVAVTMASTVAQAGIVSYTTNHTFVKEDIQCDRGIIGAACLGPAYVDEDDGLTYYGIDSAYGMFAQNFNPAALLPKPMDGIYDDGAVNDLAGGGIMVKDAETNNWKTGPIGGEWMMGLGALKAKAGTEKFVVIDHLMRDPADPNPLQEGIDFSTRLKDDGKILYYWGNYNQEPTPIYISVNMPLPDAWKVPGANYKVVSAKLIIDHDITNSPNDQIRPEDFENENATGILPQYTICPTAPALNTAACVGLPDGTWVSSVDSQEGGDLELLPAGTVLKALNPVSGLFEYTNAWYTTLDRDPFGGLNPRFRLKSSKFGQDLPGVEIEQYIVGTPTTTTIDLLSIKDAVTGLPVLADTKNWDKFLDETTDIFGNYDPIDGFSAEDCLLTPDFDLMMYIKGEVGKNTVVRTVQLVVEYDCPECQEVLPVDLAAVSMSVPPNVYKNTVNTVSVTLENLQMGAVPANVTLVGKDLAGVIVANFSADVTTTADSTPSTVSFQWVAPAYGTTVKWTATVSNPSDINNSNNVLTAATLVKK